MAPSLLLDPRAIVLSENLIFILTAGFTSAQSKIRPFIFAGLTGSTLYSLSTFSQYIQNTGYLGLFLGASLFTVPLVFFDRLILRHWDYKQRKAIFRAQGLEKTKKGLATIVEAKPTADEDTFGSRLAFGQAVSGSQRGVGESWEAKNTAHFSSKDPTYVPSAANFIAWELSKVLVCYFVYEWTVDVRAAIPHRMLIIPFFTRITEVSREEVWYRMVTNVTSWLGGWTLQTVIIGTVSAISVFFKPDEVYLWRPNFGSILDAWTVRRFWA